MVGQATSASAETARWIKPAELDRLISVLRSDGYTVVGPRIDQGAIVYRELERADQLPLGWSDHQEPGTYRIQPSQSSRYFEYNVGPQSWKQFFFPPRLTIERARQHDGQWSFLGAEDSARPRYALLGVRACELAAIRIQDRVMMEGAYVDREYASRRESSLIIAVNCTVAASTCFCTSMNTGPEVQQGYDLALTETGDGFEVQVGSERGLRLIERLSYQQADAEAMAEAQRLRDRAEAQVTKRLQTDGIRDLLLNNLDHPHWDQVASRCLSCANCTMVCPTCFCSTVEEVSDLTGTEVQRVRSWDSCFNLEFGYTAGGTVRNNIRSRYRQWLTHKLASWHDQFDSSGCVGCGRCVTWCPVGIDLTEEVAAIRKPATQRRSLPIAKPQPTSCDAPGVIRREVTSP